VFDLWNISQKDHKQLHWLRTSHFFLTVLFSRCGKPVHAVCTKEGSISGFNRITNQLDRQVKYKRNFVARCATIVVPPLLQWKGSKYYIFRVCTCSRRYPVYNAHGPYFHLWSARFYSIFPHLLINGMIFRGKIWTYNVCFDFLYNVCLKLSEKIWATYDHTCKQVFICSTRYSWQIFIKLEFYRQILEIYSNIKFDEHPYSVSRVVPCGRTDVQTWRS
jgi:hypothetical protein